MYENTKIIFEHRSDEPFRTFSDGCCGTIRTINAGGDKCVLEIRKVDKMYERNTIARAEQSRAA